MFGLGLKSKTKKVIESDLEYFIFAHGLFNKHVAIGRDYGYNEYTIAIYYVLDMMEDLDKTWRDHSDMKQRKEINASIHEVGKNILKIKNLAQVEAGFLERLTEILNQSDKSIK